MIATRGRRRHRTDNPGAFQKNAIGLAGPHIEQTSTFLAIAVLRAYDALAREFVAQQATRAIGICLATALGRHDAGMRHGRGVANLIRWTIGILVAHALIHGAIAISAVAFRVICARLAKFLHARGAATVAILDIAVVAAFIGFEDAIATSRWDAGVRVVAGIANFARRAIRIFVAHALIHGAIAISATAFRVIRACFAKFLHARGIATIAILDIAVVAAFIGFEDAIATPWIDANVWRGNHVAHLAARTIGIFVARTRGIRRITETTGARHRAAGT